MHYLLSRNTSIKTTFAVATGVAMIFSLMTPVFSLMPSHNALAVGPPEGFYTASGDRDSEDGHIWNYSVEEEGNAQDISHVSLQTCFTTEELDPDENVETYDGVLTSANPDVDDIGHDGSLGEDDVMKWDELDGNSFDFSVTFDEIYAIDPDGATIFVKYGQNVDEITVPGPDCENIEEEQEEPEGDSTLRVCKALLDEEGNITDGAGEDGEFSINITSEENDFNETATFETPLDLADDFFEENGSDNDVECITFEDLPAGEYIYEQEKIDLDEDFEEPMYHDGFGGPADTLNGDFGTFEEGGNDQSDGVINLGEGATRVLTIKNKKKEEPKVVTIDAQKVMCDTEEHLPNWGDGSGEPITETSAQDWVDQSEGHCELVEWDFQWAPGDTPNPGDNTGEAGGEWQTFSGITTIAPIDELNRIWVREVWNETLVPFSGVTTTQDESAELYCHTDVLNYDNYDFIENPELGETFYCAAFNAPAADMCVPGEQFADEVHSSSQGQKKNGDDINEDRSDPEEALGEPEGTSEDGTFFSLGYEGTLTVKFDAFIVDNEGDDISVHEATRGRDNYPEETAKVEVSQDGSTWVEVDTATNKETDGANFFDISGTGLSWIQYVRLTDTTDKDIHDAQSDGFDVDAVDGVHGVCEEPEPEGPLFCSLPEQRWADDVVSYNPGPSKTDSSPIAVRMDTSKALGPDDDEDRGQNNESDIDFLSLGFGGELILEFTEAIPNISGDDIHIYETSWPEDPSTPGVDEYPETAEVYASKDGSSFQLLGEVTIDAIGDPDAVFTLDLGSLDWAKFIKIVDTSNPDDFSDSDTSDGYDVAGVEALSCGGQGGGEDEDGDDTQPSPPAPQCNIGQELLTNGDFETPEVQHAAHWNIFGSGSAGVGWLAQWVHDSINENRPETAQIELQKEGIRSGWEDSPAAAGTQWTELDSDWDGPGGAITGEAASVMIYQDLETKPGATYEISFSFSPRPAESESNNHLQGLWGGSEFFNEDEDGAALSATNWSTHTNMVTATTTTTRVAFADLGNSDSLGTFLDDVSVVCKDEGDQPDTFGVSGEKWNDEDGDGEKDEGEEGIKGWPIVLHRITHNADKEFEVDSKDPDGTTPDFTFESDEWYLVEVTEKWHNGGPGRDVDAEYFSDDEWSTAEDFENDNTRDPRQLDLVIDDQNVDWKNFNNEHRYKLLIKGTGGALNFRVFDEDNDPSPPNWYKDNEGELTVKIFTVTNEVVFTVSNGEYEKTLEEGKYQIVEANDKDGNIVSTWEQTFPVSGPSYYHNVEETGSGFDFRNHQTEQQGEPEEPTERSGEITSPEEDSTHSGTVELRAVLTDDDTDDDVFWAVREGTCAAGTNTVFGNVDGHSDPFSWNGANFSADWDASGLTSGEYCFVFNPTEGAGESDIRLTHTFNISDDETTQNSEEESNNENGNDNGGSISGGFIPANVGGGFPANDFGGQNNEITPPGFFGPGGGLPGGFGGGLAQADGETDDGATTDDEPEIATSTNIEEGTGVGFFAGIAGLLNAGVLIWIIIIILILLILWWLFWRRDKEEEKKGKVNPR